MVAEKSEKSEKSICTKLQGERQALGPKISSRESTRDDPLTQSQEDWQTEVNGWRIEFCTQTGIFNREDNNKGSGERPGSW